MKPKLFRRILALATSQKFGPKIFHSWPKTGVTPFDFFFRKVQISFGFCAFHGRYLDPILKARYRSSFALYTNGSSLQFGASAHPSSVALHASGRSLPPKSGAHGSCAASSTRSRVFAAPSWADPRSRTYVIPCFGHTGVRRCGMACELVPASVSVPGDRRAVGVEALSKAMRHRLGSTHARVRRPLFWPNRREKVSNGLRVCPSLRLCPWRQKGGGC